MARILDHEHGVTRTGYQDGCRHPDCIAVNTATAAVSREQAKKKEIPDHVHGTKNGRTYWGCPCDLCVDANKAACRERRERNKK